MEVDASNSSMGVVLSWQQEGKMHSCLLSSSYPCRAQLWCRRPRVAAIKIALEGWRHWLEGMVPSSDRSQKPGPYFSYCLGISNQTLSRKHSRQQNQSSSFPHLSLASSHGWLNLPSTSLTDRTRPHEKSTGLPQYPFCCLGTHHQIHLPACNQLCYNLHSTSVPVTCLD